MLTLAFLLPAECGDFRLIDLKLALLAQTEMASLLGLAVFVWIFSTFCAPFQPYVHFSSSALRSNCLGVIILTSSGTFSFSVWDIYSKGVSVMET